MPEAPVEDDAVIDLGEVSLFDLLGALRTALIRYDKEHPPPLQLTGEEYSVRGQFDRLLEHLDAGRPFDLIDDLRGLSCRAEAIATFLAVLELARLNLVRVHQTEAGDVLLYRTTRELAEHDREAIGL
jgi:chromatin segregation and condensation protein Rec8/ScpA/Scc1 (kleisin family)